MKTEETKNKQNKIYKTTTSKIGSNENKTCCRDLLYNNHQSLSYILQS